MNGLRDIKRARTSSFLESRQFVITKTKTTKKQKVDCQLGDSLKQKQ